MRLNVVGAATLVLSAVSVAMPVSATPPSTQPAITIETEGPASLTVEIGAPASLRLSERMAVYHGDGSVNALYELSDVVRSNDCVGRTAGQPAAVNDMLVFDGRNWHAVPLDALLQYSTLYWMSIDQSLNGSMAPGETEVVRVTIYDGYGNDVTDEFTRYDVTRVTGDAASDALWNARHQDVGNPFQIAFSDLGIDGIHRTIATFHVMATDPSGSRQAQSEFDYFS